MQFSNEELRERARLSAASEAWLEFVKENPACANIASFSDFLSRTTEGYPVQTWPTFVGPETVRELEDCAVGFDRVLKDVFVRYFNYDSQKIAQFHGGEAETIAYLLSEPDGIDPAISRVDAILTATGFKAIEINIGSGLGGLTLSYLGPLYKQQPLIKRFLENRGFQASYLDTLELELAHMVAEVQAAGLADDEVNLGTLIAPPGHVLHYLHPRWCYEQAYERVKAEWDPPLKGKIAVFDRHHYEVRNGQIWAEGVPLHAVSEHHDVGTPNDMFRAFKAGEVVLFSGPPANLLCDKRYLALLSSMSETGFLLDDEKAIIDRFLPWTRMVQPGPVRFEAHTGDMAEVLLRARQRLVLKRVDTSSGQDVVVGPFASVASWEETIGRALREDNWIAQSYQASVPMHYLCPKQGMVPHEVAWGLFCIAGNYSGAYLRTMPIGGLGVVNAASGATESIALEVEELET